MANRAAGRDRLSRMQNGIRVDAVMAVEVGNRPSLPEMLHSQWADAMTVDRTEPRQGRRMAIKDSDEAAMGRDLHQQTLNVGAGVQEPVFTGTAGRGPAGVEAIGRCDSEQADVAPILG